MKRFSVFLLLAVIVVLLPSCQSVSPTDQARAGRISAEPSGNYWVGRRFHWKGTRLWGYLRKPNRDWSTARLVVMDERRKLVPDRVSEINPGKLVHGYDHNYEYHIRGRFTGVEAYDPNANLTLPTFVLHSYRLVSKTPGYIFRAGDHLNKKRIPRTY